jgi:hypothetical protein
MFGELVGTYGSSAGRVAVLRLTVGKACQIGTQAASQDLPSAVGAHAFLNSVAEGWQSSIRCAGCTKDRVDMLGRARMEG